MTTHAERAGHHRDCPGCLFADDVERALVRARSMFGARLSLERIRTELRRDGFDELVSFDAVDALLAELSPLEVSRLTMTDPPAA